MKVNWWSELCCEFCGNIIHNHFHCPVCNIPYASTSIMGDLYEEDFPLEFECEECRAKFIINKNNYDSGKVEIFHAGKEEGK